MVTNSLSGGVHPIYQDSIKIDSLQNKNCITCHKTEHKNWQNHLHSQSFVNPRFRNAFTIESFRWCLNCHAPYWNIQPPENLTFMALEKNIINQEGINCSVCHVRNGKIYHSRSSNSTDHHQTYRDSSLADNRFCAKCHQFNFPLTHQPQIFYGDVAMQDTYHEYLNTTWLAKETNCQKCHYYSQHRSPSIFDNNFRREFTIRFTTIPFRGGSYQLKIFFAIDKIGHAFPTGDLFRVLVYGIYNKNGKLIKEIRIEKKMIRKTQEVVYDNRYFPAKNAKGIAETRHYLIPIPTKQKGLTGEDYRIKLYDGDCFSAQPN